MCGKHRVKKQSFYREATYDGIDLSEVKGLKKLKRKHPPLNRILTSPALHTRMLKRLKYKQFYLRKNDNAR